MLLGHFYFYKLIIKIPERQRSELIISFHTLQEPTLNELM